MSYSDLKVDGRSVSFTVTGTGCDTPQVRQSAINERYLDQIQHSALGAGQAGYENVRVTH